jgi:hypothetical protein
MGYYMTMEDENIYTDERTMTNVYVQDAQKSLVG